MSTEDRPFKVVETLVVDLLAFAQPSLARHSPEEESCVARRSRANLNFKVLGASILTGLGALTQGGRVCSQMCFKAWPTGPGRSWERN